MRVSYRWLKEYVDFDLSPDELAHVLTMRGLEVDSVEYLGEGLHGVVVGEIEEIREHPNADKLIITRTNVGSKRFQIIAGARNIRVGDKVPVALPGTTLPGGLKIGRAKLRGEVSEGMLCSCDELGLQEERAPGIMVLETDAVPGTAVTEVLGLEDYVLTLDLTPNYAYALSMLGVAGEVAAYLNQEVKWPEIKLQEIEERVEEAAAVEILNPELCPRYTARVIRDVRVGPSPAWMQVRLKAAGIRPINNIVDITNYVLMEYGHPLHAFDYDRIRKHRIKIRRAREGEKLVTLDDQERELGERHLVIADNDRPICLAGVMGGANSEVSTETNNILLESAVFNPTSIRLTAKEFALHSEASHRFERGVDIEEKIIQASNRAAQLMVELAGGKLLKGIIDVYPQKRRKKIIDLRIDRTNALLGTLLTGEEIKRHLEKLGFDSVREEENVLAVEVPAVRVDIEQEADLIEEVARDYGYENIGTTLPQGKIKLGFFTREQKLEERVKDIISARGMFETSTFTFINPAKLKGLNLPPGHPWLETVELRNPLSEEHKVMRTNLIISLLDVLAYNENRQNRSFRVFEIGKSFHPRGADDLPDEVLTLAGAVMGMEELAIHDWGTEAKGFFYLKGILEELFTELGLERFRFERPDEREAGEVLPFLHPGRSVVIKTAGDFLGFMGELHPGVSETWDFASRVSIFQLDLERAFAETAPQTGFAGIPRYPASFRDIAVVLDERVPAEEVERVIRSKGGALLQDVELFDLYRGEQLPEGTRSLAYRLKFQLPERTLKDAEVNETFDQIVAALKEELDAEIRG